MWLNNGKWTPNVETLAKTSWYEHEALFSEFNQITIQLTFGGYFYSHSRNG